MVDFVDRRLRPEIVAALGDTRVVVVLGARQVGKSTLVARIARDDHAAPVLTLDDQATRSAAANDPTAFVAGLPTPVVIDEIQRAPDALLAIKQRVDDDPRPGQFLLTGSANILTAPRIADALTGRAEYYRLDPFSQDEIERTAGSFIAAAFEGHAPQVTDAPVGRAAYAERVTAGGYPEALARAPQRRRRFFESYLATLLERDVADVARLHEVANVRRLLSGVAATSSGLLNFDALSRDLGIAPSTMRPHLEVLDTLFLTHRLQPWHSNLLSRVVKTPKAYVRDSGLLSFLRGVDAARFADDGTVAGGILESFVVAELGRQASWDANPPALFHYRDRDAREVDVVLERRDGSMVAVEVKSAASMHSRDTAGLRHLRDRLGDRFKLGVVLYTGATTLPLGDRLCAVPLCGLWQS